MPSRQTTLALCGAGMISGAHAMAAHEIGARIIAVASRSEERRVASAGLLHATPITYDQLPAGAEIVIVATPPAQHFEHTKYALERGAAVLLEKPLAFTLDEADALMALVERYGPKILYAENLAYAPIVHTFIKRCSTLAMLDHLSLRTIQPPPSWGEFMTPQWGGGALFDLGVHPLALAVLIGRITGAGEVIGVCAQLEGDITDTHAEVTLTFTHGLTATVISSWRGDGAPSWDVQASSPIGVVRAELMPHLSLEHNAEEVALSPTTAAVAMIEQFGYVGQLRAFINDLASGESPFMDVAFGRWIMEIVCAAYVSAGHNATTVAVPSGCDRSLSPLQLWKGEAC